jgi:two-component system, LytTR family, sensor kinase
MNRRTGRSGPDQNPAFSERTGWRATLETLHTASLAALPLRSGLTPEAAGKAAPHLRALLGSSALSITSEGSPLVWEGERSSDHPAEAALAHVAEVERGGRTRVLGPDAVACDSTTCPIRYAIVVPLRTDSWVVGALAAYAPEAPKELVRVTEELAHWMEAQLELAELDRSRSRLLEAEVRALQYQIYPHFIYNSLTTIASFVRTDPERARELLLEFADFTRYSFRRRGNFTTLAEELRSIDRYLLLERARFGDRLHVTLRIAPEVLPVAVPYLCLQPLVENAVRHGLENKPGEGHLKIIAEDAGAECVISVEDDGVGMDPELMRQVLAGEAPDGVGIGLANVDGRLRQVYGDRYGLVAETAVSAGMKVTIRAPKYRQGVSASWT